METSTVACPGIRQRALISALIKPIGLCGTQNAQKKFRARPTIFQSPLPRRSSDGRFTTWNFFWHTDLSVRPKNFFSYSKSAIGHRTQSPIGWITAEIGECCRILGHANDKAYQQSFYMFYSLWHTGQATRCPVTSYNRWGPWSRYFQHPIIDRSDTDIQPRINVTRHRHSELVAWHLTLHFSLTLTVYIQTHIHGPYKCSNPDLSECICNYLLGWDTSWAAWLCSLLWSQSITTGTWLLRSLNGAQLLGLRP